MTVATSRETPCEQRRFAFACPLLRSFEEQDERTIKERVFVRSFRIFVTLLKRSGVDIESEGLVGTSAGEILERAVADRRLAPITAPTGKVKRVVIPREYLITRGFGNWPLGHGVRLKKSEVAIATSATVRAFTVAHRETYRKACIAKGILV